MMVLIICAGFLSPVIAEVTPFMNYQGRLSDNLGNPVPDGFCDLTFSIYADTCYGVYGTASAANVLCIGVYGQISSGLANSHAGYFMSEGLTSLGRLLKSEYK